MIRYIHGQTAFCFYVLDQMALHVYLQKVICGKNETSLVHVRFLSGIGSGSIAIFKHKNVHTMHFLFVFKLLFEKKGGGIFGDHNLPSGDQKFILDRQLALVLKSYFRTLLNLFSRCNRKKESLFVLLEAIHFQAHFCFDHFYGM